MTTDVESEALVLDRAREPTDVLRVLFQDDDLLPVSGEFVTGSETCRSGPDNDRIALGLCLQNLCRSPLPIS